MNRGEVVAVGPGSEKDKVSLKIGDIVILPSYGGTNVNLSSGVASEKPEETLVLLRESEILAKVIDN